MEIRNGTITPVKGGESTCEKAAEICNAIKYVRTRPAKVRGPMKTLRPLLADRTRYALDCVWVEPTRMVATDGYRLWIVQGSFTDLSAVAPRRMQHKAGPTGTMYLDGRTAAAADEKIYLPEYQWLLDAESGPRFALSVVDALHALKLIRAFAKFHETYPSVGVGLWLNTDKTWGFSIELPHIGTMSIGDLGAWRLQCHVNPKFLDQQIRFHAKHGHKSIDLASAGKDKPLRTTAGETIGLLMPVNTP